MMTIARRSLLTTLALTCVTALTLLAQPAAAQSAIAAHDAWMREPLPNRNESAIFVVVDNNGAEARSIVSASTPIADKTELHNMTMDGGMMKMAPVKAIELKANAKTELKPGSFHIMLFGLKEKPGDGASVPVTLTLDNGQTVSVTATVRKMEGMRR